MASAAMRLSACSSMSCPRKMMIALYTPDALLKATHVLLCLLVTFVPLVSQSGACHTETQQTSCYVRDPTRAKWTLSDTTPAPSPFHPDCFTSRNVLSNTPAPAPTTCLQMSPTLGSFCQPSQSLPHPLISSSIYLAVTCSSFEIYCTVAEPVGSTHHDRLTAKHFSLSHAC